jgi:hypothetical protein
MNQPRTETLTSHCDTCGVTSTERTDYCQSCAKELVRIFPDERTSTQYDDALEIRFSGGIEPACAAWEADYVSSCGLLLVNTEDSVAATINPCLRSMCPYRSTVVWMDSWPN